VRYRFAASYWQHSLGDTLSCALPLLLRQGEPAERWREPFWQVAEQASLDDPRLTRAPRQRQVLQVLSQHPHGVPQRLLARLQLNRESLNLLLAKGLVEIKTHRHAPIPLPAHWLAQAELALNAEQQAAFTASGINQFARRYGFLDKPLRIRFRLLDTQLPNLPGCTGFWIFRHHLRCRQLCRAPTTGKARVYHGKRSQFPRLSADAQEHHYLRCRLRL